MNSRLRSALEVIPFLIAVALIWIAIPMPANAGTTGRDVSRCECHRATALCGLTTVERNVLDREFLSDRSCVALPGSNFKGC